MSEIQKAMTEQERRALASGFVLPLDLASLEYSDTVPTEPGWWSARRIDSGDCCVLEVNGYEKWLLLYQWGPLIARLATGETT